MSTTIKTVYHNKAGEIVASWEQAESVTYHTICTDEQADAAEAKLVALAHEFAEKHYKEVQKENYSIRGPSSRTALTTCRPKYGKLNLNNTTMINANKEEIRKALEDKGAEFRASLDKTMEVMDKYQDAIENERIKAKFKKAQDEYIRHISKLAPQNERLSLEFSKIAGLALYYELPVDEKTLSLALNYVNRRHGK